MIVRRLAAKGIAKTGSTEEEPTPKRAKRFLLIVFSTGALFGLAALLGIPPFGNVQALIHEWFYSAPAEIPASRVFPSVSPVQQAVDIYDPAPPTHHQAPPAATQPPGQTQPNPTRTPPPTPTPDD